ncbi:hypothetical protein F8M41_012624 [Gigaspora margarita]|uniref:Uncharacterized protein n=1 Tax=Gigaspora margarita TaxID=4874 RepID=A0A8H4ASV0_GIGMA|nr:hypothetical protein F8M41_012624 [Gigaspora margarita]
MAANIIILDPPKISKEHPDIKYTSKFINTREISQHFDVGSKCMEFAIPDDAPADAMDIRRSKRISDDAPASAMDSRRSKRQKTDQVSPI